jgi:two-component system sensor histidine kinase/response regulator
VNRQQERRLLLNQVIAKIQDSLELTNILETTVAEVRRFLQADRLVIYQFNQPPSTAAKALDGSGGGGTQDEALPQVPGGFKQRQAIGYITYESRAGEHLASVLNYTEHVCFQNHPDYPDRAGYFRQGAPIAIDDVTDAYGHVPCMLTFLQQVQVKSKAVAPILVGQNLWGLLIVHQCDTQRQWQPGKRNFCNTLPNTWRSPSTRLSFTNSCSSRPKTSKSAWSSAPKTCAMPGRRRGRQPGQKRVFGHHEPRAAYPPHLHHRHVSHAAALVAG